jgi:hypothetical protein
VHRPEDQATTADAAGSSTPLHKEIIADIAPVNRHPRNNRRPSSGSTAQHPVMPLSARESVVLRRDLDPELG